MKQLKNKIIIAAAGSGKTTHLISESLKRRNERILITTFTDANTEEIKNKFYEQNGIIPGNIEVIPWFTFLLRHCVRPYQGTMWKNRIDNIILISGISAKGISESNIKKFYFNSKGAIYSDKISNFAFKCNERNSGAIIRRLEKIYDTIFIDEIQDLSGWDLEILNLFFSSSMKVLCVGDPRQGTLRTNNSLKNRHSSQTNLLQYLKSIRGKYSLDIDTTLLDTNHRSIKEICDFSNLIYSSEWPKTKSDFLPEGIDHLGIYMIDKQDVKNYLLQYNPIQLRDSKKILVEEDYPVMNIGKSKGKTLNRILIYPLGTMMDWLIDGTKMAEGTRCKLYVAVTRARYSVGIVRDEKYFGKKSYFPVWKP